MLLLPEGRGLQLLTARGAPRSWSFVHAMPSTGSPMSRDEERRPRAGLPAGGRVPAARRSRMVFVPTLIVVVLAAAWTVFWFHAASVARATLAGWQAREEQSGRSFRCGSQSFGGYPFRIEMRCTNAAADLQKASPPLQIRVGNFLAVAQVYQPTLLIVEFGAPLTVTQPGSSVTVAGEWTLAQASLRGLPTSPERVSAAIDNLRLSRPDAAGAVLFGVRHVELHARLDPASRPDHPVVDLAARIEQGTAPSAGPPFDQPLDVEIAAVLEGLPDLEPKPAAQLLRELQQKGGVLQVVNAHVARAGMLATGTGTLGLSPQGRLDGAIDVTISGLDSNLLEGLVPSLKGGNASLLGAGLLALLGKPTELEGRPAVVMPLRFTDGAVALGPVPLGRIGPLY